MWARIITLQRTIHTPTLTMQGGETTPIFHGVTIRMCRIHKGIKEISSNYQAPPQVVQPNPEPKKNDLESALLQFMTAQQQSNTQTSQAIQKLEVTTSQAIQRLETQVGQLAKELSERKMGEFPAQTILNPRGHEQLKAITTLRSGKTIDNKVGIELDETIPASPIEATTSKVRKKEKVNAPPFLQRLVKPKKEQQLMDIFETLRKVEINIHLLDAI
jgi:hypothetical protein